MSRVVIVGAGVVGLMCGYELRRSGLDVTILDRSQPGRGASWANMGWVVPSFARPLPAPGLVSASLRWMFDRASPLYIAPRADPELARWLWSFWRHCNERDHQAGLEALAHLAARTAPVLERIQDEGLECEMHSAGVLFLFLQDRARDEVYRNFEFMTGAGVAPRALDRRDVQEMEPHVQPQVTSGIFVQQERHLRPESLVAGLERRLREMGVLIRAGVDVTGASLRGGGGPGEAGAGRRQTPREVTAVVTTAGAISGDLFLLTAGAWTGILTRAFGLSLPLQGGKGYTITIDQPAWQPAHALYLDEARIAVSPYTGELRIGGTMEFSGFNTDVSRGRIEAIRAGAARYLRDWPGGRRETFWAGLRPLTPDGLPVLGRVPGYANVFVATGHGMLGITLAPATAAAMAQLVRTGEADLDLTPFRPDRFTRPSA
jgi:D-amino-acid dehydrogenase